MECDILDSLEQLGYDGPLLEEEALLRAAEGGLSSQEYVELCRWLASRLHALGGLEETLTAGAEDMDGLQVEMSGLLKELHCPYEEAVSGILKGAVRTVKDHLKFLLFLSSELQAAQIVSSRQISDKLQVEDPVSQDLSAICDTLKLPEPRGADAAGIFSQIQTSVDKLTKDSPNSIIGCPVLNKPLSTEQWAKLHSINTLLCSEYECRRRMLIKRLDVTVQSFGWSDRAKVKVDSMAGAYQPRRHSLRPQADVDMAKLLAARDDICNVVKTSSGSSKTTCAVNKVRMGRVPDRGGRPSEIEAPPPEMPAWKQRQEGGGGWGGHGRGGGGWRGQGRGRGGGGGWRGGGWNHGGHGGQRGRY